MQAELPEFPETLIEAIRYFTNPDVSLAFMVSLRWTDGVTACPRCSSDKVGFLASRRIWKCKGCKKQFSVKVGTIFEDSPLCLDKWLPAVWCIVIAKNGISSCELALALGVTQKTAWFMLHRIRLAMAGGSIMKGKSSALVKSDETYVGRKAEFMHNDVKQRRGITKGNGTHARTAVIALLDRHMASHSKIVSQKVLTTKPTKKEAMEIIRANVAEGSEVQTDQNRIYDHVREEYIHGIVNHAQAYVHTNGLEYFWSLLERALKGTYISVEPCHLFRYVAEQVFRFNERKDDRGDSGRFLTAMAQVFGKRITYKQLTGAFGTEGDGFLPA